MGESCATYGECLSGDCRNQICVERCSSDRPCPEGQFCSWDTQQCRSPGSDGAVCNDDEECLSGWCTSSDRCATRPQIGDRCARSSDCYPLGYCTGGTCAKRLEPGAACQALDSCQEPFLCRHGRCEIFNLTCAPARTGSMCAYLRVCEDGAYCDVQDAFTCKPRKSAGADCLHTAECQPDLFCQSDSQGMRRCLPRLGLDSACQGDECAPGLFCVGDRTSRRCQAGPVGQPCNSQTPCPTGYHCNHDGVCQAPHAAGADCLRQSNVPCAEGLYCDFSNGCRPKRTLGEACSSSAPCADSLRCWGSPTTCQPRARVGEACSGSSSDDPGCEAGLFCEYDSTIKMTICQAAREVGAVCDGDSRCQSGVCGQSRRCLQMNVCVAP